MSGQHQETMQSGWLRSIGLILAAAAVLLIGGACGVGAHNQDVAGSSGPLPGFAATLTTLVSLAIAMVIGAVALLVGAVRREARVTGVSIALVAAMLPVGVWAGIGLARSGALPRPAPTETPQPPPATGRMSLNLVAPFPPLLAGRASCSFSGNWPSVMSGEISWTCD